VQAACGKHQCKGRIEQRSYGEGQIGEGGWKERRQELQHEQQKVNPYCFALKLIHSFSSFHLWCSSLTATTALERADTEIP
jgi:hypothetical protein